MYVRGIQNVFAFIWSTGDPEVMPVMGYEENKDDVILACYMVTL
jgi:hypothetical protein